jgi:dephospho-CoA kinase
VLRVGLTGGMGCGKTTVAEMLSRLGAHVLLADTLAHELMQPGSAQYQEIVRRFGQRILKSDGGIDRPKLAALAFAPNAPRIAELNAILHPAVMERQKQWMDQIEAADPKAVAVVEAALLLEAGGDKYFDKIVVVSCQPELKPNRVAQRLRISESQARAELERRSAAQWSDEKKAAAADYIIENSGSREQTEAQVAKLFEELTNLAAGQR